MSGATAYLELISNNFTSISGGTAAVGYQGIFASKVGSVTVSRWDSCTSQWVLEQTIDEPTANGGPDTRSKDMFGSSVSLAGDKLVVGANYKDFGAAGSGIVYEFTRSGTTWSTTQTISAPTGAGLRFGWSIAQSSDASYMATSGPLGKDPSSAVTHTGYVAVYQKGPSKYQYKTGFVSASAVAYDYFGYSLAIDGNAIVAGAPGSMIWPNAADRPGKAWVFTGSADTWTEQALLQASDGVDDDWFGKSVAKSGTTIVVGAPKQDSAASNAGAAYIFTYANGAWSQTGKLTAPDATADAHFGFMVAAVSSTRVLVSAADVGKIYSFSWVNSAWVNDATYTACSGNAGYTLAVSGNLAIAAKPGARIFDLSDPDTTCVP